MKRLTIACLAITALALVFAHFVRLPATAEPSQPSLRAVLAAGDWIGGRESASDVTGNVVVLDVFTVDCYNCQNVVPTLRALDASDRVRGLRIVGIHAPETPAEKGRAYVTASLARQGIAWPVAVDNSFALWKAYGITAWPTQLFFDRRGRLRETIVGDSQDANVRATVDSLLAER
jgi:thiol-disulfide isomerase/thioredoxin